MTKRLEWRSSCPDPETKAKDDEEGEGVFYLLSWGGLLLGALHLLECFEVAAKLIPSLVSDSSARATPSPCCFFPPSPPSPFLPFCVRFCRCVSRFTLALALLWFLDVEYAASLAIYFALCWCSLQENDSWS